MKKLLDIRKADLFKEAFALAIKRQQNLIVEKENAIQFGFSPISGGALTTHNKQKLITGIIDSKQYIEFYTDMYINAEELRTIIADKRSFLRVQKEELDQCRKENKYLLTSWRKARKANKSNGKEEL
tara:strand:- start:194 stop:574 length:381 start_codon:yes stop_codon:yes gene_type:complete